MSKRTRKVVSWILVCVLAVIPLYSKGTVFSVYADEEETETEGTKRDADLLDETEATRNDAEPLDETDATKNDADLLDETDVTKVDAESQNETEAVKNDADSQNETEAVKNDAESQDETETVKENAESLNKPEGKKRDKGSAEEEGSGIYYCVQVEGFGEGDSYYVEYSYDGEKWIGALADDDEGEYTVIENVHDEFWFELKNIPEGITEEDTIFIRVTGKTEKPSLAFITCSLFDFDHDTEDLIELFAPDDVNCNVGGDENGIFIEVEVPFSHVLLDTNAHDRRLNLMADYIDAGDTAIAEEVNNYIYAYDTTEPEDTKARLAAELYNRFIEVAMFGEFGIRDDDPAVGQGYLRDRISPIGDPYQISALDGSGQSVKIDVQDYEIAWGNSQEDGKPFKQIIPVYALFDINDILVCVDYDKDKGTGETFYIRSGADVIPFTDDPEYPAEGSVIYYDFDDYNTIVAGGNGRMINALNKEGMYSVVCAGFYIGELDLTSMTVRVMKPNGTYIVLKGEGEEKEHGIIGDNGFATDIVWATGGSATASVYIGDTTVYLERLCDYIDGVEVKRITGIQLINEDYKDGVSIDDSDLDKIKLTFSSNFYDTVSLLITYSDGSEKELTIRRIGLVIQYTYLGGNPNEDEGDIVGEIRYDYREDILINFDYNYYAGEQILIMASYYHPTNDNTVSGGDDVSLFLTYDSGDIEVLDKTAYTPASENGVACTTFIIGFAPAKTFDGLVWLGNITEQTYERGGFHAMVVNAGFDSKTSYSGTQTGSDEGVYWDGSIRWFE